MSKATPTARTELVDQISLFLATNYPCDCGAGTGCSEEPEAEAIVEMMEAAGFGLVADTKAEAWDRGMADMLRLQEAGPGYEMGNPYRKYPS